MWNKQGTNLHGIGGNDISISQKIKQVGFLQNEVVADRLIGFIHLDHRGNVLDPTRLCKAQNGGMNTNLTQGIAQQVVVGIGRPTIHSPFITYVIARSAGV